MSRVIKVRGYHVSQKKMYSAEELAEDQLTLLTTGEFINVNGRDKKLSVIYSASEFIPLQYTGLKDMNGKELYESDIVEINRPGRDYQTHYGENIPGPTNSYTEPLEPTIKTERIVITFRGGVFASGKDITGDGYPNPLVWELQDYDEDSLICDFTSNPRAWSGVDDDGEGDLSYLLEEYPPNNIDELIAYCSGCKLLGNIHQNKDLLD